MESSGTSERELSSSDTCISNSRTSLPLVKNYEAEEDDFVFNIDSSLLVDPGHVLLGKVTGEGSNSIVHEGIYQSKPVAVKILRLHRTSAINRKYKEKFQREVTLLSRTNHENILKFVGACIEPSMMLITELMGGSNLQKYLWRVRPKCLELKLSISFALDISRAMEYLHAKGIIHRDLKPSNILLTEDMKHVKLGDFGLAREEVVDKMTCEAGTYRWMAPEIFSQDPIPFGVKKHYDHKVDVYSFAMVLWELLTNKVPFQGRRNMAVAYAAAKNIRPSVEDLPEEIVPLLKSCWAQDPEARPEFTEITVFLTNYLNRTCSTEVIRPIPNVVEIEEVENKLNKNSFAAENKDDEIEKPNVVDIEEVENNFNKDFSAAENKRNEMEKPKNRNCLPKFLTCFGDRISR